MVGAPGADVTLDGSTGEFGTPGFIKIDVDGGELDVLRGAEEILREHRPSLIVETHSPRARAAVRTLPGRPRLRATRGEAADRVAGTPPGRQPLARRSGTPSLARAGCLAGELLVERDQRRRLALPRVALRLARCGGPELCLRASSSPSRWSTAASAAGERSAVTAAPAASSSSIPLSAVATMGRPQAAASRATSGNAS